VGRAHGSAEDKAAATALREPFSERESDVKMGQRIQAEANQLLAVVLSKEMTWLARTRIGDDETHIEITKLRIKGVDGGLLGEVYNDASSQNPELARDVLGKRFKQVAAAGGKRDIESFFRQPAHEFGSDTGRGSRDERPRPIFFGEFGTLRHIIIRSDVLQCRGTARALV